MADNRLSMTPEVESILKLRVPVIVRLAHHEVSLEDILDFGPGRIIELPKDAEDDLDLMVNNIVIGRGNAVKVGENFGLRIKTIGKVKDRINALGGNDAEEDDPQL